MTTHSDSKLPIDYAETFRFRFRFRVQKRLDIQSNEYTLNVCMRDVVLSSQDPDSNIRDSDWLVMNARGFESEDDARKFAENLKVACEVSSVATRLGIDTGADLPTTRFMQQFKDSMGQKLGALIRDNVHGVDVFVDDQNVCFPVVKGNAVAIAKPDPFLADLSQLYKTVDYASQEIRDITLLLNYALTRSDLVAQIVFAFSAVEMLGQSEKWSADQNRLLNELAAIAQGMEIGTAQERQEVAEAIQKGTHKLSLRQGVLRLLTSLDLDHLKNNWDRLYPKRSKLVHGLAPKPGADYRELATEAVSLCGQILLKAIAREVTGANSHVDTYYKVR